MLRSDEARIHPVQYELSEPQHPEQRNRPQERRASPGNAPPDIVLRVEDIPDGLGARVPDVRAVFRKALEHRRGALAGDEKLAVLDYPAREAGVKRPGVHDEKGRGDDPAVEAPVIAVVDREELHAIRPLLPDLLLALRHGGATPE